MLGSPRQRLKDIVSGFSDVRLRNLADAAGVERNITRRVLYGQKISADHYVRLCALLGRDPLTLTPRPQRKPYDIDRLSLARAFRMTRYARDLSQREAAKVIGNFSFPTISRLENAHDVSVENFLTACRFMRVHPDLYTPEPTFVVKRVVKHVDRARQSART